MKDVTGFDGFYLASRDRVVLHVAALTGDPVEALDHVQEAFIRAWTRWDRIGTYDDPEAWVRRVAYNCAVSRWRWSRRLLPMTDPGGHTRDARVHLDPDQHAVIDVLRLLPARERRVIVLHHLLGYSIEEIAAELSAPAGSVKSWLFRARATLAAQLTAQEAVDDLG